MNSTINDDSNKKLNFIPPIFKERKKKWVHKATFTVIVSQLGFIILMLFIGPSDLYVNKVIDESSNANTELTNTNNNLIEITFTYIIMWWDTIVSYLHKGSLLLSIMSLGATAAANYFWDARKDKEDTLLFETNKSSFIVSLILVFSAGIVYAILPEQISIYFICLQLIMFLILVIYIYKINYAVFYKEQTYADEVFEEQKNLVMGTNNLNSSTFSDDIDILYNDEQSSDDKMAYQNVIERSSDIIKNTNMHDDLEEFTKNYNEDKEEVKDKLSKEVEIPTYNDTFPIHEDDNTQEMIESQPLSNNKEEIDSNLSDFVKIGDQKTISNYPEYHDKTVRR